jgi:DNA-directed RNA polymerase subunit E'/Rpb7
VRLVSLNSQVLSSNSDDNSEEADKVWVWRPSEGADYWFDPGTVVRFRVERETWNNLPDVTVAGVNDNPDTVARLQVPYSIEASMAEPGLGGEEWW